MSDATFQNAPSGVSLCPCVPRRRVPVGPCGAQVLCENLALAAARGDSALDVSVRVRSLVTAHRKPRVSVLVPGTQLCARVTAPVPPGLR